MMRLRKYVTRLECYSSMNLMLLSLQSRLCCTIFSSGHVIRIRGYLSFLLQILWIYQSVSKERSRVEWVTIV